MVQTQKTKKLKFVNASKHVTQTLVSPIRVNGQKKLKKLLNVPEGARTAGL